MNYGGLEEPYIDYYKASIVILPVKYDACSTWLKGADRGPEAILEASENMELYDIESSSRVFLEGIHTGEPITENESPERLAELVDTRVNRMLTDGKFPVLIGGNHACSIGAFRAFAKHFNDLTILQLDAHADLRQEYMGSSFNHACVMSRASEIAPIVQVGIRSMSAGERGRLPQDRVFFAHDIRHSGDWITQVISKLSTNVYITIDLDVFDPSIMPSTGTPEPDGLLYHQVFSLIKAVNEHVNIVGFDIVELSPNENNKSPDFLAAKLIYQILSLKFKA